MNLLRKIATKVTAAVAEQVEVTCFNDERIGFGA